MTNNSRETVSAAVGVVLAAIAASWAQAQTAPPLEALGGLPQIIDIEISPDGSKLATLEYRNGTSFAAFYNLNDLSQPPAAASLRDLKVRNIEWGGDDYVIVIASFLDRINTNVGVREYELFRSLSIKSDTSSATELFDQPQFQNSTGTGAIIHLLPDDPDQVLMSNYEMNIDNRNQQVASKLNQQNEVVFRHNLFRVNLRNGRVRRAARGNEDTVYWLANPAGEPALRVDQTTTQRRAYQVNRAGISEGEISTLQSERGEEPPFDFVAATKDPGNFVVYGANGENLRSVFNYDAESQSVTNALYRHESLDVDDIIISPYTQELVGVRIAEHERRNIFIDEELAAVQAAMDQVFEGMSARVLGFDRARDRFLVAASAIGAPDTYFVYFKSEARVAPIAREYPSLGNAAFGTVISYPITSRDGVTIPGYLTLPPGVEEGSGLPLVVLPHGGPASRNYADFDWWAQVFATRGYAVYQPNFRGSDGYGVAFEAAGAGEWGGKMQDDVTDGVRVLIDAGVVDAERICIVGASYGGYAALAGATLTPDLYSCAASYAGVSDLPALLGYLVGQSGRDSTQVSYWRWHILGEEQDYDLAAAKSPINNVRAAIAPILLIHGEDDTVVDASQSRRMAEALAAAGKPHKLVMMKSEDHWLSREPTRQQLLQESLAWVEQHIGQ
ncbi:MAG: S9 family peptidase [Parvularculaceae bacterium]